MRKALKRQLGREKQAENLQKSIKSGLEAQNGERDRREREFQKALIARDTKPKYVDGPQSQISKDKAARVAKRLAEKEQKYAPSDLERQHAEEMIDLERREGIYKPAVDAMLKEEIKENLVEYV